jgi:hypothetical protein
LQVSLQNKAGRFIFFCWVPANEAIPRNAATDTAAKAATFYGSHVCKSIIHFFHLERQTHIQGNKCWAVKLSVRAWQSLFRSIRK